MFMARTTRTLIVNDLRLGDSEGGVALWGAGHRGVFRGLKIALNN